MTESSGTQPSQPQSVQPVNVDFKGDLSKLKAEVVKGKILENALREVQADPNFNPQALSIVFGLKW